MIGLVGILAAGELLLRRQWALRRESTRLALLTAAFLLVLVGYRAIVQASGGPARLIPGSGQLDTFAFYREMVGWREYRRMLPLLVPQLLAIVSLLGVTVSWVGGRRGHGRELAVGWTVLGFGVLVLLFHAGRFSYFHMTVGLFPAVVGALMVGPALDRLSGFLSHGAFMIVMWVPLATGAALTGVHLMTNGIEDQREAVEFVERNFPADARGYDAIGVFSCRDDPDPFPVRFAEHVWAEYSGADGARRGRSPIDEFRERQVRFMILPLEHRSYPAEVRQFWDSRYVPYHGPVRVPGQRIDAEAGWIGTFEVIVPGKYVWRPDEGSEPSLQVDGRIVRAGGEVQLGDTRPYGLGLPEGGSGTLALSLPEPPSDLTYADFWGF